MIGKMAAGAALCVLVAGPAGAGQITGKLQVLNFDTVQVDDFVFTPATNMDNEGAKVGDIVTVIYSPAEANGQPTARFIEVHK